MEEVLPNLFRVEVPLPRSPLKALNSYVIRDGPRPLVVDTGMNRDECHHAMLSGLAALGLKPEGCDFFVTHLHADHLGLVDRLARDGSAVYFSEREAPIVNNEWFGDRWSRLHERYLSAGFPEAELNRAWESHPGRRYGLTRPISFKPVRDGDRIQAGGYSLLCVETRGHTAGHMCLYEPEKRLLFAGDHVLCDITPNITFWPELENSLKEYLASLDKVYDLEADLVLPGHRSLFRDLRKRIAELRQHHKERLDEVLSSLDSGPKTAFEVAPHIAWDIKADSWAAFPPTQKWFAVGETVAHLNYLVAEGKALRAMQGDREVFSRA